MLGSSSPPVSLPDRYGRRCGDFFRRERRTKSSAAAAISRFAQIQRDVGKDRRKTLSRD
jgi:hypothetical protein